MTREISGRIRMVVSDDGTRCAAECPHLSSSWCECTSFRAVVMRHEGGYLRAAACIAAEHAAASVPSCEGARGLDASEALREAHRLGYQAGYRATAADASEHVSRYADAHAEALREARVQGMREALEIVHLSDVPLSPTHMRAIDRDVDAAIEAVRKGER